MKREDYLRRLGLGSAGPPGLDDLLLLHERHLLSVPFESLDIQRGGPIVLEEDLLLDNVQGEEFRATRVADILQTNASRSAPQIRDAVLQAHARHCGARAVTDDVTVVVVKRL